MIWKQLIAFPVFSSSKPDILKAIAKDECLTEAEYLPGERANPASLVITCILTGEVAVYSPNQQHPVLLKYLGPGQMFGIASLFSNETEFSHIEFKSRTKVLQVPKEVVTQLLSLDSGFREAYLEFLSDRIAFLNKRISCVSAGSAEHKLGLWLCSVSEQKAFDIPLSMVDLANLLDLGRASLYRAFDKLASLGWLTRNGSHIEILDRSAILENKY